jgi:hypothetical protein
VDSNTTGCNYDEQGPQRDGEGTFAGMRGNDRVAPKAGTPSYRVELVHRESWRQRTGVCGGPRDQAEPAAGFWPLLFDLESVFQNGADRGASMGRCLRVETDMWIKLYTRIGVAENLPRLRIY